ncbi:MAG TPA: hypothetical protein DC049_16280 [Spirochaetia bacterium]|nr:hypothetical protein [Spirochaetia bacterium]
MDASGSKVTINNPVIVQDLKKYYSLYFTHKAAPVPVVGAVQTTGESSGDMFMSGRIAMLPGGHYEIKTLAAQKGFSWDITTLPIGKNKTTVNNAIFAGISRYTKNKKAAWKFIMYIMSEPAQAAMPLSADMPVTGSGLLSDAFIHSYKMPEVNRKFIKYVKNSRTWPKGISREVQNILNTEINFAIAGEKTFEQACADAAKAADKALAEQK